jgi:chlorobactene glucosyltransferase
MMASRRTSAAGGALLWLYAASIAGFYAVAARRTLARAPLIAAGDVPSPDTWPLVSIIVPARNEERNIRDCVESLLAQDFPCIEVLVVDDGSTDTTPAILRELSGTHPAADRLRVLRVESLPPGWVGKPHAMHTGATAARGEWLLFTDADTRHAPGALRAAVRHALARGDDLLSLGTQQDVPDVWGRVVMPFAYMGIALQYPVRLVNDPRSPVAIANGQYLLIRRAFYDRVGGYAAPELRATVLDDRDLAQVVKRAGGRLELADGRELVRTRMYHTLREQWEGWSKNAYAGSRGGLPFYLLMLAGLPATSILPFVLLLSGLLRRNRRRLLTGAVATGAIAAYRTALNREQGIAWRYVWTHPLAAAIFWAILVRSFWRVRTGRGVTWRDRTYQL